jgi:hypothetical protein
MPDVQSSTKLKHHIEFVNICWAYFPCGTNSTEVCSLAKFLQLVLKAEFWWLMLIEPNKVQYIFTYIFQLFVTIYCRISDYLTSLTAILTCSVFFISIWHLRSWLPVIIGRSQSSITLHRPYGFLLCIQLCCCLLFIVREYWGNSTPYT